MALDTDALLERRRLKRRLYLWRGLFLLALLAVLGLLFDQYRPDGVVGRDHIARLRIDGAIMEDSDLDRAVARLAEDRKVKAVILRINSPGGSTFGGEALYLGLRKVAEKKPVVAVIGTLGASAGYLVALAGDRVIARETSLTGSIGVLFQTAEFTGLMDKIGVTPESVTSGPLKDNPSPFKKTTPEGRAAIQATVDQTFAWFVTLVEERRKLPRETVLGLADGRIFTGRQALAAKLIDEFGGETEALAWLESKRGIDPDLPVQPVRIREEGGMLLEQAASAFRKMVLSERLTLDGLVSVWHPYR
jgi:protease-4